jgi:hypothetical protein
LPQSDDVTPAPAGAGEEETGEAAAAQGGSGAALRRLGYRALAWGSVPFFLVSCTFTYYGQLHRKPSGDTYGTVYTAVALVQQRTIWLDDYVPYIERRAGQHPYMLRSGPSGHTVTSTPTASSVLALPAVALFHALGADAADWEVWMEAGMLTAALTTALSVAVVFVLLTRLTTRRRATLVAATYAWGTLTFGISGQALWQHSGVALALAVALLALVTRRLVVAGVALGAMGAFRLSAPIMGAFLLPLVGRRRPDWLRLLAGMVPYVLALAVYNTVAFGSPLEQGYGTEHIQNALTYELERFRNGIPGLLVWPGRGLFVYSPVLLFAVVGAVLGWRTPLYRWCAVSAAVYLLVIANSKQWHGGESFGPRKLADLLPLLAVLLVPAVDRIVRTRWLWVYLGLLAYSVFIQLLAAAAWLRADWFDDRNRLDPRIYRDWTDNEILAMLQVDGAWPRVAAMVGILALGLGLGAVATYLAGTRGPAARAEPPHSGAAHG